MNRIIRYIGAHDVQIEFALSVHGSEQRVTIVSATNKTTGKDTGLSDERLIEEVKAEIKSRGLMVFNYDDLS